MEYTLHANVFLHANIAGKVLFCELIGSALRQTHLKVYTATLLPFFLSCFESSNTVRSK